MRWDGKKKSKPSNMSVPLSSFMSPNLRRVLLISSLPILKLANGPRPKREYSFACRRRWTVRPGRRLRAFGLDPGAFGNGEVQQVDRRSAVEHHADPGPVDAGVADDVVGGALHAFDVEVWRTRRRPYPIGQGCVPAILGLEQPDHAVGEVVFDIDLGQQVLANPTDDALVHALLVDQKVRALEVGPAMLKVLAVARLTSSTPPMP